MIDFPKTATEAAALADEDAVVRAGATDLHERRRLRIAEGHLVDLRDVAGLDAIEVEPDRVRIGARVTIADLGAHAEVRRALPGLAAAASGLATPEIRAVGTVGGNLLQHPRCWYYRHPTAPCLRKGGHRCSARGGDHRYHACFELAARGEPLVSSERRQRRPRQGAKRALVGHKQPMRNAASVDAGGVMASRGVHHGLPGACVAVHASTLAMVLLAHDARIEVEGGEHRDIDRLLGDGWMPSAPAPLEPGSILTHVDVPVPEQPERAAYFRAIARARAEWPLVEAYVRLRVDGPRIADARVVVGAVANTPLRLPDVEAALVGRDASPDTLAKAAALASKGASPLPMTHYKVALLEDTVLEVLERALDSESAP